MEKRFESAFVRGKEAAGQLYRYWFYKQPIYIAVHIISALYCLAGVIGLILKSNNSKEFIPILICYIIFELCLFITYNSSVRTMVKRDAELSGGELVCTVSVYDDEVVHSAMESTQSLPLSKIKKVFTTKDFVVICTEAGFVYMMRKDSFTLGDADSLITFLKEKGIKVRR